MSSERANKLVEKHMRKMHEAMKNGNKEKAYKHYHAIMNIYGIE